MRLNGTLNNPIYRGQLTFNRWRFSKDPDTSRRIARSNPPEIWITENHPELRIVSEALWNAVARERRRHDLDRRIANLLTALEQGTAAPSLSQRLAELEFERDGLMRTAPTKPPPFRPTPDIPRVYRQWLGKIETVLTRRQSPERAEATERFRSLISGIYARRGHQRPTVTLEGYVGAILQAAGGSDMYGIVRCGKAHWTIPIIKIGIAV